MYANIYTYVKMLYKLHTERPENFGYHRIPATTGPPASRLKPRTETRLQGLNVAKAPESQTFSLHNPYTPTLPYTPEPPTEPV